MEKKENKEQEEKILSKNLESVEQQLLELKKKQQSIQESLKTTKATTKLLGFANIYLSYQQKSILETIEQKIQQTEKTIGQINSSVSSLTTQLKTEENLEKRTNIRTEIEKQQKEKTACEKELQELKTTNANMENRINRDKYTWTDYSPFSLLSSRK